MTRNSFFEFLKDNPVVVTRLIKTNPCLRLINPYLYLNIPYSTITAKSAEFISQLFSKIWVACALIWGYFIFKIISATLFIDVSGSNYGISQVWNEFQYAVIFATILSIFAYFVNSLFSTIALLKADFKQKCIQEKLMCDRNYLYPDADYLINNVLDNPEAFNVYFEIVVKNEQALTVGDAVFLNAVKVYFKEIFPRIQQTSLVLDSLNSGITFSNH